MSSNYAYSITAYYFLIIDIYCFELIFPKIFVSLVPIFNFYLKLHKYRCILKHYFMN